VVKLAEMGSDKGWVWAPESGPAPEVPGPARVRRLTHQPCRHHLAGRQVFTPEGDVLIFVSDRDGAPQLFELRLEDGSIRKLTEGAPVRPFTAVVHHGGDKVFFVRGGSIWMVRRSTLEESCVLSLGQAWLGPCALAGDWLAAPARQGRQYGLVIGRTDGTRWDFLALPRRVVALEFHPLEHEWLELSFAGTPRMHRMRRDGAGLECLYAEGPSEQILHETFLGNTGDLVFAMRPQALCRMDWESRRVQQLAGFSAWHPASNSAGTLVACDTDSPDQGIFLVDALTGVRQSVCLPGSSNQSETADSGAPDDLEQQRLHDEEEQALWTQPRPAFTPDGRALAFVSDRSGYPQLYLANLEDLPAPWFGPPPV